MTVIQDRVSPSQAETDEALHRFVDGFASPPRAPVFHSPSEHGLEYEDVTFLAADGVPLEAWFIPAPGSNKVIIAITHWDSVDRAFQPSSTRTTQPGRQAETDSKSIWYPITRSSTMPDTTC